MKNFNPLNALQISLSIALSVLLIVGFYAVAFHVVTIDTYKTTLISCTTIMLVQMLIEALRAQKVINL